MIKHNIRLALFVGLGLFVGVAGCEKKAGDEKKDQAKAEQPTEKKKKKEKEEAKKEKPGAKKEKPHSSSIPGTENQLNWDQDIPEVTFEITGPEEGEVLDGSKVEVEFEVDGYRIGREIGQHVHFILDNKPYAAHYEDGEPQVFEGVEPGTHTLRAFPSRHYHLSLKKGRPFDTVVFHVKEKSEEFNFDPDKPYLTYSRPKGTYSAEAAQDLLLDFYVSNIELGEDAKAVYSIDGEKQGELTEWKPQLISLEPGEHDVNLKLVDGDGELIENGGYNDTTRTITVKE